jgi:hypothetical protein
MAAMSIRLKYRQGSFAREEAHATVSDAIVRAEQLLRSGSGCSCFQVVDHLDKGLRRDPEIFASSDKQPWQRNQ